ncbi:histidine phosphatase family protein [Allochromatium vinosum]|uniref:Phosphoglycerate mutase n=1 Tax=Allochromatium vinosum (strain ATCC 17899 / DSM 180 / NBRC 103801 / NCIMB 10441 / D) TaxID=572477 RepID=D3RQ00_ALLVD|nr:histidine phosphatase family protein [Allochromatium vinosum]ADC63611.1 Phosphoglycerate mutase [Allochromatium vinosum DSM 180]
MNETGETVVDFMRHGEPVGGRRYRGHGIDDPLSPLGWEQMRRAVGEHCQWDQIISSPLHRCRLFAAELAARHALPLAVDSAFREIGMGAWEGRSHQEIRASESERFAAFKRDPVAFRPPGSEPLGPFQCRIVAAYERQVAAYPGRRLLIVCHAGVIRAVLGHALDARPERWYRLQIGHATISRIRVGRFGISAISIQASMADGS